MPGLLTLRDFKGPVITVQCKPCGQKGELDRKTLVREFGASMRFVDLRRRMAMGCDKMHCSDGRDRCGTQFPCLLEAGVAVEMQASTCSEKLSKLDYDPKGSETSP